MNQLSQKDGKGNLINADRNYFFENLISRRQLFPQEAKNKFTRFSPLVYISTSPCPESTIKEIGIKNRPKRTCDESPFNWIYDNKETCYCLSSWFRNFLLLSCLALEKKIFGGDVSMTLPESINKT